MTDRISWKNILEGLGVLALVASLLFVGFQLQQDRDLASAQVIVNADAVKSELLTLISDNSDIWLRGLKGEELSAVEGVTFRAIAAAHFARHLGVYQRLPLLGSSSRDIIAQQYALDLYQYVPLRKIFVQETQLMDSRNRYFNTVGRVDFRVKVNEYLDEMDENRPDFRDETFFPF